MKAGRELDARIAERVMGERILWAHAAWSKEDWLSSHGEGEPTEQNTPAIVLDEDRRDGDPLPRYLIIPRYSTSIADAWSVVDTMERRGFWCEMRTPFMEPGGDDGYWAGFTPHSTSGWNGRPDHWTRAESLPLAICLAALKACGVEGP